MIAAFLNPKWLFTWYLQIYDRYTGFYLKIIIARVLRSNSGSKVKIDTEKFASTTPVVDRNANEGQSWLIGDPWSEVGSPVKI